MEDVMRSLVLCLTIVMMATGAFAEAIKEAYTLPMLLDYALTNNPKIASASRDVEAEGYGIAAAKGEERPKVDFTGGVTRYRYDNAITPITGSPLAGSTFPEFDNDIYDLGVTLKFPLYMGGRLQKGVSIAGIRKAIAEDVLQMSRQELIYNVTAVYYKILQLERLKDVSDAAVRQLEAHRRNVELFLKAGTAPKVELLKTEAELAHMRQNALSVKNSMESAYEMLKTLMGIEDPDSRVSISQEAPVNIRYPSIVDEGISRAFVHRPDYAAVLKKANMVGLVVGVAEGKAYPSIFVNGEYSERSGDRLDFKDNWNLGLRLSVPLFEGGVIRAGADRERMAVSKTMEEERALRLQIMREVKDAYLTIDNARMSIDVSQTAVEAARETLRIEILKFESGAGTSTDVIDAQSSLLRAEADNQQAVYDRNTAIASLRRAMGEDVYEREGPK